MSRTLRPKKRLHAGTVVLLLMMLLPMSAESAEQEAMPGSAECSSEGSCRPKWNWYCFAAGQEQPINNYCEPVAGDPYCP